MEPLQACAHVAVPDPQYAYVMVCGCHDMVCHVISTMQHIRSDWLLAATTTGITVHAVQCTTYYCTGIPSMYVLTFLRVTLSCRDTVWGNAGPSSVHHQVHSMVGSVICSAVVPCSTAASTSSTAAI
jgi:hypothetical protein